MRTNEGIRCPLSLPLWTPLIPEKLWKARSRLHQRRFLQPNTHFSGFFENYTIYKPSHRSNLKICWFFPKISHKISENFRDSFFVKFCWYLLKSVIFRRDFHGFLPEFHGISAILMELMLQFSKFQNFLRKSRNPNFAEIFCRNSVASFRVSPIQQK